MAGKIKVLIVDDSALMREALKSIIASDPGMEIVGTAKDGEEGTKKVFELKPDVITMDLKMPIMTGLEAIQDIMKQRPTPIIVVSSMDVKVIVKALTIGAMDFVPVTQDIEVIEMDLLEKIKIASRIKPLRRINIGKPPKKLAVKKTAECKIIAIGVSTGGPQALQVVLSKIPQNIPAGILVVQHISDGFVNGLAEWLKAGSFLDIKTAKAGDILKKGETLFAPDKYNMNIENNGKIILKEDTSRRMIHVPSIDETMKSVAETYGKNSIGVIMTGMGRDGVEGIKAISAAGGTTIAQDEASSVIFGMNKLAIDTGCVDMVVPLEQIADEILKAL